VWIWLTSPVNREAAVCVMVIVFDAACSGLIQAFTFKDGMALRIEDAGIGKSAIESDNAPRYQWRPDCAGG